jgi:hypothetical protein
MHPATPMRSASIGDGPLELELSMEITGPP